MASEDEPLNLPGGPTFSQRLWSEEVAIARAISGEPLDNRDDGYVFSNGRTFKDIPYSSQEVVIPPSIPANSVAPVVSGLAVVGSLLTCTTGTWTGTATITYSYQWLSDGSDIVGETASTYTTIESDVGASITCRVTATNAYGSASANSNVLVPDAVLSDGIFFDTARGDTFTASFDGSDASLTVTDSLVSFSSGTTKTVDFVLKDDVGGVLWQSLDYISVEAAFTMTSFPAADAIGWFSGFINSALSEYAGCIRAHPGSAVISFDQVWVSGSPSITGGTYNFSVPTDVVVKCRFEANLLKVDVTFDSTAERNYTKTLNFVAGITEMPRMFSKVGVRWKSGVSSLSSMKVSASYPNAKYAFIGDSITQGRFVSSLSDAFPQQVRATYPNDVIVSASPAAKITEYIGKTYAIRFMLPKYVFVMLGINDLSFDSSATAFANYKSLVNEIEADGAIAIIISTTPFNNYKVAELNALLAVEYSGRYIDVYSTLIGTGNALNPTYDYGDGTHLNTAGNTVIANAIKSAIASNGWS